MCYILNPKEDNEKRPCSGTGEGFVFCTEPDLNVNTNNTVSFELVVLLRSLNQRLQLGLTRGQKRCAVATCPCIQHWAIHYQCNINASKHLIPTLKQQLLQQFTTELCLIVGTGSSCLGHNCFVVFGEMMKFQLTSFISSLYYFPV